MTSGTRSCGHPANLTIRIFEKVREPIMFTRWLSIVSLRHRRNIWFRVLRWSSLPADSMAGGSPTELSVKGLAVNLASESPPANRWSRLMSGY